jgi:hypothetical protein
VMVCEKWCRKKWAAERWSQDGEGVFPLCLTASEMRAYNDIPVSLLTVDAMVATELSLPQRDISLGGGTHRGAYLQLRGDVCVDESVVRGSGASAITRERSLERREVVKAAARSMAEDGRHEGVKMYKHVFELGDGSRPEHGVETIRKEVVERGVEVSRGEAGKGGIGGGFHAHVTAVSAEVRRSEVRRVVAGVLWAGYVYCRRTGNSKAIFWDKDVWRRCCFRTCI